MLHKYVEAMVRAFPNQDTAESSFKLLIALHTALQEASRQSEVPLQTVIEQFANDARQHFSHKRAFQDGDFARYTGEPADVDAEQLIKQRQAEIEAAERLGLTHAPDAAPANATDPNYQI